MDISVSSPTVQKILKAWTGVEISTYRRLLKLEEKALEEEIELTAEQIEAIEKANSCFKERHMESSCPGELLQQDTFHVGWFKSVCEGGTVTGAMRSVICMQASCPNMRRRSSIMMFFRGTGNRTSRSRRS